MGLRFLDIYNAATNIVISDDFDPFLLGACSAKSLRETYAMMHNALGTDLSVEVGAHEAVYSLDIKAKYGVKIAVCAVEGSPKTHAYYAKQIDFAAKGVEYIHAVVSESEGEVSFYEYERDGAEKSLELSSLYARKEDGAGLEGKRKVAVASLTGDSLLSGRYPECRSAALWIDAEGAQKEVLFSFAESFKLGKINSVFIEVEGHRLWPEQKMLDVDVINHMRTLNFMPFLRDNEYGNQYNIVFINNAYAPEDFKLFYDYYLARLRKSMTDVRSASFLASASK